MSIVCRIFFSYRPILLEYGLFYQVRVDQGKEWLLWLYIQESLAHLRYRAEKPSHRQTTSTLVIMHTYTLHEDYFFFPSQYSMQNHTIERCWPEVSHHVNYQIKSCLIQMQERGEFHLDSTMHKYCVPWIKLHASVVGIRQYTASWNCHYIPGESLLYTAYHLGKGIPNDRASKSHAMKLPEYDTAVSQLESMGEQ